MGAGGSSEEREVTVEQDDSDSSGLSIKVYQIYTVAIADEEPSYSLLQ